MLRRLFVISLVAFSSNCFASGVITGLNFSGPNDGSHQNIVQIQIAGGYNVEGCNQRFAAIRNIPEQQHMISFALAAYMAKEPVNIALLPSDKYHSDRCAIHRISTVYN